MDNNERTEIIRDENVRGLNKAVVRLLREKGMKLATAESLTGGLVSDMITEVPGASEVFECGVCSYSNRIKSSVLGVSEEALVKYTEYSGETACEMAEGIRKLSGADIGVSTTGIAGPGGGTAEKPVGLVYIGISSSKGARAVKYEFGRGSQNERVRIRKLAALNALELVRELLDGE